MIILDSYAWIEYFLGSDSGRIVKDYIDKFVAVPPNLNGVGLLPVVGGRGNM